jgi:hypothetical protein
MRKWLIQLDLCFGNSLRFQTDMRKSLSDKHMTVHVGLSDVIVCARYAQERHFATIGRVKVPFCVPELSP